MARSNQWTGPIPIADRFWEHVDKSGGPDACWIWTGARDKTRMGYGIVSVNRKPEKAHRVSMMMEIGEPIPTGLLVCHRCDNPPCVRPSHLFLGTSLDNVEDMVSKGRSKSGTATHCSKGHPRSICTYISRKGQKSCLACRAEYNQRRGIWPKGTRNRNQVHEIVQLRRAE